nr:hypothetical protein [Tanacetum cinerariifolium]
MTSFGYRLNPRYAIKECLSYGALYTRDFCCSKGNVKDKILVTKLPKNCARCAKCGHSINGPYCKGCTLLREKLEEDLVTYFQNFQNTFESFDDSTNVVNAPREPFIFKQDHGVNPPHIDECCCECGDTLDGVFCQQCTCKSCGKGAHIGYNCPPKVQFISNPEPCNQAMNNELPQTLPSFDSTCYSDKENSVPCVSKPNFVDESSNIFNPPLQAPIYSCEFCGSNAQYGHYCTPQAPFINTEPGYSQDFNFPQNIHDFQQQYLCCDQCGGLHETFQCQQVIFYEPCCENYGGPYENFQCQSLNYYEHNPSYDSNYSSVDKCGDFHPQQYPCCDTCGGLHETFQCQPMNHNFYNPNPSGFDQTQPPQFPVIHPPPQETSIKILHDQENEPVNSLSMGDDHLDIIPATESNKVIKSSVEDLVPIPSESEGIPDTMCDVHLVNNPTPLTAKDHFKIALNSNNDISSNDDDSLYNENIEYVEASPHVSEVVSLEAAEIVILEVEEIKDDNLRENLLNVHLLIANIKALKDNPTPSSEFLTKSSSTSPKSFLEETNTFYNSLPEFENFCFDLEEISSGSTTTHFDISLPDYKGDAAYLSKTPGHTFDEVPFKEEIMAFLRFLRHIREIKRRTDAQILWGSYHKRNVDFTYLLWEDFIYQAEHKDAKKSNEMYYP